MSDLIERDKAIDAVKKYDEPIDGFGGKIEKTLRELPSAQPEPDPRDYETDHGFMWLCPNCGLIVHSDHARCWRCGHERDQGKCEAEIKKLKGQNAELYRLLNKAMQGEFAEQCEDCVSRKAVVSRISDLLVLELKGESLPTWNEVYNAIAELPSVTPKSAEVTERNNP